MCGIAGIFKLGENRKNLSESVLKSMSDTIEYRGPDDVGIYCDLPNGIGLAQKKS